MYILFLFKKILVLLLKYKLMKDEAQIASTIQQLQRLIKSQKITQQERQFLQYFHALTQNTINTIQRYKQLSPSFKKLLFNYPESKRKEIAYSQYLNIKDRIRLHMSRRKVMMRKQGGDQKWSSYFIQCDFYHLFFFRNEGDGDCWRKITIENVWLSKNCRKVKKQYVFTLVHHKKIYEIGFRDKLECQQTHSILIEVFKKKRQVKSKAEKVGESQSSISQRKENSRIFEVEERIMPNKQLSSQKGEAFESQCRELIDKYNTLNEFQYNLHHNIQNGKFSIFQNYLKLSYFLPSQQSDTFATSYIQMHKWNTLIDEFKFQANQQFPGLLYANILLKQYNFMTYPRSSRLKIVYVSQSPLNIQRQLSEDNTAKGISYIFIKSQPCNCDKSSVGMNIEQYMQIAQLQEGGLFVNIISMLQYHSYKIIAKDIEVNLAFLQDVHAINNICNELKFSHQQRNTIIAPYHLAQKKEKGQNNTVVGQSPFIQERRYQQQLQLVYQYHKNIKNQQLVKFISNKIYEKYYIKSKFIDIPYQKSINSKEIIDFLFRGGRWKLKNGSFVFSDEQCLSQQKGLIKKLIKKIGSNIMSGKSVMNVSLPVEIFSTKSALQAFCDGLGFFPAFIKKAITCSEITEQIKYVTMCYFFKYACNSHILKPFNPILGETFQCVIGDIPFYFEQISHHPPVASLYIKTDDFQSFGNYDLVIEVGLNVAYFKFHSLLVVKIPKTNSEYYIKVPNLEVGGVMLGDRTIKLVGKGFVLQKNSNTLCEISIGKERKGLYTYNTKLQDCDLAGGIFKISNAQTQRILACDRTKSFEGAKAQQVIKSYSKISGKWYGDMYFDEIAYKTVVGGPFPLELQRPPLLLPSDSLFRKDICFKKWGDNDTSNIEKEVLEDLQRNDRKLRQKYRKK